MRVASPRRLAWLDALAAAGYLVVVSGFVVSAYEFAPAQPIELWLRLALVAATGAPLALRRRWPVPVWVAITAVTAVTVLLPAPHDGFAASAFALYTVAARPARPTRSTALPATVAVVGALCLAVSGPYGQSPDAAANLVVGVVLSAGAWALGVAVADRRVMAARSAAQLAQREVAEERLRIARELHDVVAHNMSLIAVKAAVANHVADKRPEESATALRVIETTARDTLTQLRQIIGTWRGDSSNPMPGVAQLGELRRQAAGAGLIVDLAVDDSRPLPSGIGLAVYRIVQESLTNVVKHAPGSECRVDVSDDGARVRVEVSNTGRPRRRGGYDGGHGLIGMSERVATYGGSLEAGPTESGFSVIATIPHRGLAEEPS